MNHHMTCKSISSRDKDAKSRKVLINLDTVYTGPIHMIIELDVYNPYQQRCMELYTQFRTGCVVIIKFEASYRIIRYKQQRC